MEYDKFINYLGHNVKEKVTGVEGVVSSVSFDLFGCVQVCIAPKAEKKGEEAKVLGWYDIARIEIKSKKRVMEPPYFMTKYENIKDLQGAAEKPVL